MARRSVVLRGFQAWWRATRSLTLGAQGCVIDREGRVLLVRHGYRPGWHFPGGGVDRNEHVERAVIREIAEETGVVVRGPPRLVGIYANFRVFPSDHVVLFEVRDWEPGPAPPLGREIAERGFFGRDALPEGTVGAVHRRLAELFDGATPSADW